MRIWRYGHACPPYGLPARLTLPFGSQISLPIQPALDPELAVPLLLEGSKGDKLRNQGAIRLLLAFTRAVVQYLHPYLRSLLI